LSAAERTRRIETEKEQQALAVVERKVMMPMPDGVRLATDIYIASATTFGRGRRSAPESSARRRMGGSMGLLSKRQP
jgi:predicted acyl esterase